MDVFYPIKPQAKSGTQTLELRYSLRSLRNLPHDKVVIAGWKPEWVTGVGFIPTVQRLNKFINAFNNLQAALPVLSEEFVLMNDDFFILTPHERIPTLYRDQWEPTTAIRQSKRAVLRFLQEQGISEPVSYELHVPMVFNRDLLQETLKVAEKAFIAGYQRTVYGNLNQIGGTPVPDVKTNDFKPGPFISTSFHTFQGKVGQRLMEMFDQPSPYECT